MCCETLLYIAQLALVLQIAFAEHEESPLLEIRSGYYNKWTIVTIKCLTDDEYFGNENAERLMSDQSRNDKTVTEDGKVFAKSDAINITEYDVLKPHDSNKNEFHKTKNKRKYASSSEKDILISEKTDLESAKAITDKKDLLLSTTLLSFDKFPQVFIERNVIPGSENTRVDINCRAVKLGNNLYSRHIRHLTLNTSGTIEVTPDWLGNFTNLISLKVLSNNGMKVPQNCSWIPKTLSTLDLSHTPLEETHLSDCRTSLKYLIVSGSSLQSLYMCLPTLESLDASWNSLGGGGLRLTCDGGANSLRELKKTHNQLTSWSSCRWPALTHVQLENNKIQHIDLVSCPPIHLLSLNLASNRLHEPPSKYPPKLETINLSHNRLKKTTPFNHIIQEVDLSYNSLTSLGKGTFRSAWQLLMLKLAHNKLSIIYGHDFTGLNELRHLDLSHNTLQHVRHEAFHPLQRIQIIKLNNNALHSLDVRLLSYLPRNLHFEAYNNPWRCSCHLLATLNRISKEYCAPRCPSKPAIHCVEGHVEVSSQDVLRQCIEAVQNISEPEASIHLAPDSASDEDTSEERTVTIKYKAVAIPGAAVMVGIMFAMIGARQAYRKRHNIKRLCLCCKNSSVEEAPATKRCRRVTEHTPNSDSDSDSETEL